MSNLSIKCLQKQPIELADFDIHIFSQMRKKNIQNTNIIAQLRQKINLIEK